MEMLMEKSIDAEYLSKMIFSMSIASKDYMLKDIDSIFNANKLEYIKACRENEYRDKVLITSLGYKRESHTLKVLGIVEYGVKTNNYENIILLYKKAYRRIYNNLKNLDKIYIDRIFNMFSLGLEGNNELFSTIFAFETSKSFFSSAQLSKNIDRVLSDYLILETYQKTNFSDNVLGAFNGEIQEIKNMLGIKNKTYTFEKLLSSILEQDARNYNNMIINKNKPNIDIDIAQKIGSIGKYIGSMEGVMKFFQINSAELSKETLFTSNDVSKVIASYLYAKKFNNFKEEDMKMFIINTLYFSAVNQEYKSLKNDYSKSVNDEHLVEMEELHGLNDSLISTNTALKNEMLQMEKASASSTEVLMNKIKALEKENAKLKDDIKDENSYKNEIVVLREFIFNLEEEIIEEEIESIDIESLNKLNVVICGGSIIWVKKIKEVFPNWVYVSSEQRNNDLSFIKNCDFVFLNTKMKHSLSFKIQSIQRNHDFKFNYIKSHDNIKLTINDINNKLKKAKLI